MTRAGLLMLASLLAAWPAAAQTPDWPSERPPRALRAHGVPFPPYEIRTLPNGLQVIAVSHHEQPAVSLRLIVRAGPAQDPADKQGTASLVSTLLDQGTTTRSAEQIASAIDSIGGSLLTGAGADLTFIQAIVMKDSFNVGLDLVSDVARHPAFAPDEIERQRQQLLSGLQVSYDDPSYLADMVFDRLVYGFHPYGRPQAGTPATIRALTREDLLAFHKAWFGANNAILAVVGDITPDEAFAGAARAFGDWAKTASDAPAPIEPPPPTRRVVVIDKPGSVQTEIRVGNIGIPRKHPDYMALDLAIKVLGGEGANRLHRVLRSERGLTYGASADLSTFEESGDIAAETSTRSATTGETLRLTVDEIWKLIRDPVGTRELAGAQEYLTGSFPLTIETPSQIALQVLNAVFYGLDLNELQTYRERVNGIDVEDIQRVARMYLHPDRLTIVLVGDASAFVDQLAGAGFDKYERIPVGDLDLASPDLRRKPTAADGRIRPASLRSAAAPAGAGQALIDKAISAKGGLAKLSAIRTVRAESTTTVQTAGGAVALPNVTSIEYPDRFRVDAETPAGRVTQVYADGQFWVQDARGAGDAPPEVRDTIRAGLQRDTISVLLKCAAGALTTHAAPGEGPLAAVQVSGKDMPPFTLFIDRDTGLIARVEYDTAGGTAVEEFSDYRSVDGIQVAFHAVVRRPGLGNVERDVQTIHFNVPLAPGLFTRPG